MASDDIRLGEIITPGLDGDIVLIGYPCDYGVARNNGRMGASEAPAAFRRMLKRTGTIMNPELSEHFAEVLDLSTLLRVTDAGDITATEPTLEAMHEALHATVSTVLKNGGIPFIVGGGNDQSWPNASALLDTLPASDHASLSVINIDAHLDVRPLKPVSMLAADCLPHVRAGCDPVMHSGSPFRMLLEDKRFTGANFYEFACQGSQCSHEHANYVRSKGGHLLWFSGIEQTVVPTFKNILSSTKHVFVSYDVDAIISASCPGVSAPATFGISARDAVEMAFEAGLSPNVRMFDMSEFNPRVEEYRTAKLVTQMFYHFVCGVARRRQLLQRIPK
jgi:formiminoglutamase